jgi:uncharacterized protein YegL
MEEQQQVKERDGEVGQIVMPFYVVCDVSWSMKGDMGDLNIALQNLHSAILDDPVVHDVARLSVITFSEVARVVTPMGAVSESSIPHLSEEGGTNYGAAFECIARTIKSDRDDFAAGGYKAYRPCVFFLTDGCPQDGTWLQTFDAQLTYDVRTGAGMRAFPIFIPFGFSEADEKVLAQLAYPKERGRWYLAKNIEAAAALEEIRKIIMKTVVTATMTATTGQASVQPALPMPGSGVVTGTSARTDDFIT